MNLYAFADEANSMIDQQIEAMLRNGLQGIEIRNVDGVNVSDITLEKAAEVRAKLDAAGLVTWSIGSAIGKVSIESDIFEEHLDKFRHTLEIAQVLGAKNIRLFSFFIPEGKDPELYRDEVISRMQRFVEIADGTGIDLCHENEKGIFGDNAARCLEILRAVPKLKAVFDPANFVQCAQDTLEAWEMLHSLVKYMHIKDALSNGFVVPAGKGNGNLPELLKRFRAQGGNALSVEPHLRVFSGLDTVAARFEFGDATALFYASTGFSCDAPVQLDLYCEHATLRLENDSLTIHYPNGLTKKQTYPHDEALGKGYWGNGHFACIQDFYNHINTGIP